MVPVAGKELRDDSLSAVGARALAESLPHMVWVNGPDGAMVYLNAKGVEFFGPGAGDPDGWSWLGVVHPDDVAVARSAWSDAIRDGADHVAYIRMRRADGAYRWIASRGSAVRGPDGSVARWVGTFTDIDEYKRMEVSLRRAERATAEALTLLDTLQSTAPVGFLFVDQEFRYVRVNEMAAAINGVPVGEHLGRTVAEVVPALWPQIEPVFRGVLDRGEAVLNVEITGETSAEPGRAKAWLVSFYPVRTAEAIIGIGVVIVDITERKEAEQAQRALTNAAVGAIAATVEARDPYTAGHQRRVADNATAIAAEMRLDTGTIDGIRLAAHLHDIGKIAVPTEILTRPGPLRPAEYELVKDHSRVGCEIVEGIAFARPVAQMILQHHERLDGSGYPDGLRGDEILIGARVIAVADVVDAMATHRPYRAARGVGAALEEIERNRGRLYDPAAVDACLRLYRDGRLRLEPVPPPSQEGAAAPPEAADR